MALAITAVIGLAIAGVAAALSSAYEHGEEYYSYLQNGRVASVRLQQDLRQARLITAASDTSVVLWLADRNEDGQMQLSELGSIYHDANTHELVERTTVFPETMAPSVRQVLDFVVALSDVTDPSVATGDPVYPSYDSIRILASNVSDFRVYADPPPPLSRLVKFRLTVGSGDRVFTTYGAANLRVDKTAYVGESTGVYVLHTTEVRPSTDPDDANEGG